MGWHVSGPKPTKMGIEDWVPDATGPTSSNKGFPGPKRKKKNGVGLGGALLACLGSCAGVMRVRRRGAYFNLLDLRFYGSSEECDLATPLPLRRRSFDRAVGTAGFLRA